MCTWYCMTVSYRPNGYRIINRDSSLDYTLQCCDEDQQLDQWISLLTDTIMKVNSSKVSIYVPTSTVVPTCTYVGEGIKRAVWIGWREYIIIDSWRCSTCADYRSSCLAMCMSCYHPPSTQTIGWGNFLCSGKQHLRYSVVYQWATTTITIICYDATQQCIEKWVRPEQSYKLHEISVRQVKVICTFTCTQ